jgi:hypothetical protein
LGSRTGGALEEELAAAAEELVDEAGVEAEDPEAAADFEAELEQPVRERAATTTATAAIVKEGRFLTMTPLVSCQEKGRTVPGTRPPRHRSEY